MINPPHILTARLERAIVVNEHARYTAHCCGDCEKEDRLRLELDILNKQYWASHGYCFHSQGTKPYKQACITNGECRQGRDKLLDTNYPTGLNDRDYRGVR